MISVLDFMGADGKTDWTAFEAAKKVERSVEVATGTRCCTCGQLITCERGPGRPAECIQCVEVKWPEPLRHDRLIRCPKCGKTSEVRNLFQQGEHDVSCSVCGYGFTVETVVEYSFRSPARLAEGVR